MEYPEFESDLYKVYESEVMGEALFGVAATLTLKKSRKQKWITLAKLESQTKNRYLEHVGTKERYPFGFKIVGCLFGVLFAILPWKLSVKLLGDGTQPFLEVFSRLLEHSSDAEAVFYKYLVAHEEAIAEFAELELQGNTNSLKSVDKLLGIGNA